MINQIFGIFSSYSLPDSIRLSLNYLLLIIGNRIHRNERGERFLSFLIEFPYRPAFFGLISEIFFHPFPQPEPKNFTPVIIIDGGANIGIRTLFYIWRYPNARVLCFEPNPVMFRYLNNNMDNNHLSQINTFPYALGREDKDVMLYFNKTPRGSGSATVVAPTNSTDEGALMVPMRRLSHFIDTDIYLLKLDIEGAEMDVLDELCATGKIGLIQKMVIEYHFDGHAFRHTLEEFLGKLKREGYSCIHTTLEKGPSAYVEANYVMSTCMIYAQRI